MEIAAARSFNALYIYLDLIWLAVFVAVLLLTRRYQALLVGLAAGVIYFAVDYGLFYQLLGTRTVTGADTFWLLLWLSFSYGLTNFAWIWLLLDRDGYALEWSLLPIGGWIAVAFLSQSYGSGFAEVATYRGTASYHGGMALVLVVGYFLLIVRNLRCEPDQRVNLGWLLAIGIGIQLAWETVLLLAGIRPPDLTQLAVKSLIETNLGLPWAWMIHRALNRRRRPDLSARA